jgi:hypothetical protein
VQPGNLSGQMLQVIPLLTKQIRGLEEETSMAGRQRGGRKLEDSVGGVDHRPGIFPEHRDLLPTP